MAEQGFGGRGFGGKGVKRKRFGGRGPQPTRYIFLQCTNEPEVAPSETVHTIGENLIKLIGNSRTQKYKEPRTCG